MTAPKGKIGRMAPLLAASRLTMMNTGSISRQSSFLRRGAFAADWKGPAAQLIRPARRG